MQVWIEGGDCARAKRGPSMTRRAFHGPAAVPASAARSRPLAPWLGLCIPRAGPLLYQVHILDTGLTSVRSDRE